MNTAATIPGKCAAPPAAAIITLIPRRWAVEANSNMRAGVRCAETMVSSKGTPNRSRISAHGFITDKSESLPMITDTTGSVGDAGIVVATAFTIAAGDFKEIEAGMVLETDDTGVKVNRFAT